MSLDSNGSIRVEITFDTNGAKNRVLNYLEDVLGGKWDIHDLGGNKAEVDEYIQNDHFYAHTAESIAFGLMDIEGVTIEEFESEILDEDGKHTHVRVQNNRVQTSVAEIVYKEYKEVERR